MKDDQLYLTNILECIERIENYTQAGQAAFQDSTLLQDAVIRNLEIIGEATKRLSPELCQASPNIPWKQMAGMRDVLIHDYLKINLNRVWQTIEQDLPTLKTTVMALLQSQ